MLLLIRRLCVESSLTSQPFSACKAETLPAGQNTYRTSCTGAAANRLILAQDLLSVEGLSDPL